MKEYYFWPDVHEGLRELYLRTHFAADQVKHDHFPFHARFKRVRYDQLRIKISTGGLKANIGVFFREDSFPP